MGESGGGGGERELGRESWGERRVSEWRERVSGKREVR